MREPANTDHRFDPDTSTSGCCASGSPNSEPLHIGQDDDSPEVLDRFRRKIRQFLVPALEPR